MVVGPVKPVGKQEEVVKEFERPVEKPKGHGKEGAEKKMMRAGAAPTRSPTEEETKMLNRGATEEDVLDREATKEAEELRRQVRKEKDLAGGQGSSKVGSSPEQTKRPAEKGGQHKIRKPQREKRRGKEETKQTKTPGVPSTKKRAEETASARKKEEQPIPDVVGDEVDSASKLPVKASNDAAPGEFEPFLKMPPQHNWVPSETGPVTSQQPFTNQEQLPPTKNLYLPSAPPASSERNKSASAQNTTLPPAAQGPAPQTQEQQIRAAERFLLTTAPDTLMTSDDPANPNFSIVHGKWGRYFLEIFAEGTGLERENGLLSNTVIETRLRKRLFLQDRAVVFILFLAYLGTIGVGLQVEGGRGPVVKGIFWGGEEGRWWREATGRVVRVWQDWGLQDDY